MSKLLLVICCFLSVPALSQQKDNRANATSTGKVKIIFKNLVKNAPLVLYDSAYTNPWGELYTVSKLKYYISNTIIFSGSKMVHEKNGYHLLNQSMPSSLEFSFALPENNYDSISFLPGVDSIRNVSGAQTGVLDPLNDMFWTWNSGYIMQKLEAVSPQSNIVNHKVEYHIGGFSGENSVLKFITLAFPPGKLLKIKKGKTSTLVINADLNKIWQGDIDLKISETPACSSPGVLAKKIAGNFAQMFSVADIINNE